MLITLGLTHAPTVSECRYCGNAHDPKELCRPARVSRRTFLLTASAAAAGAVLPAPPVEFPDFDWGIGRAVIVQFSFIEDTQLWVAS